MDPDLLVRYLRVIGWTCEPSPDGRMELWFRSDFGLLSVRPAARCESEQEKAERAEQLCLVGCAYDRLTGAIVPRDVLMFRLGLLRAADDALEVLDDIERNMTANGKAGPATHCSGPVGRIARSNAAHTGIDIDEWRASRAPTEGSDARS